MRKIAYLFAAVLLLAGCQKMDSKAEGESGEMKADETAPTDLTGQVSVPFVIIHSGDGDVKVQVELARTDEEKMVGLSKHESLAKNYGMWFMFDLDGDYKFWMKDMKFDLDMVFVNSAGEVVGVVEEAKAGSLDPLFAGKPFKYVLEVNSGFVDDHDIEVGNKVDWMLSPGA